MSNEGMMHEDHRTVPSIPISVIEQPNGWTEVVFITCGPDNRIHHYMDMPVVRKPYSQD